MMFISEGLMNDLTYTFADMSYRTYQYSLGNNNYIRIRVVHGTHTSFGDKSQNSHLRMSHRISCARRSITDKLALAKNIIFAIRWRSYVSNHIISGSAEIYDASDSLKAFYITSRRRTPGTTRIRSAWGVPRTLIGGIFFQHGSLTKIELPIQDHLNLN